MWLCPPGVKLNAGVGVGADFPSGVMVVDEASCPDHLRLWSWHPLIGKLHAGRQAASRIGRKPSRKSVGECVQEVKAAWFWVRMFVGSNPTSPAIFNIKENSNVQTKTFGAKTEESTKTHRRVTQWLE
jgi:hypothetical protein